ncbi:YrhK family protein [Endozoicomonas sp. G2_2]|uniref:YrhK family protein n=1 Tax=Gammaproteobacteria TaxID=1236 RepID=UPI000C4DFC2F|nr:MULTISPECIES: YrhK family protein [Gammaproteobacteria]MAS09226.1 cobalamin biosynthesis protein CobQ [Salinisphaera sp.]MBO9468738.1 YrhK family protein [Endozoicomonas sp. G2_2]
MTRPFENQPGAHPTRQHEQVYGRYEKLYTLNDFCAALLFLVGSIMFFYKSLEYPAVWCFTIGSVNFMLRPTIKLIREYHLANLPLPGDDEPRYSNDA